MGGLGSDGGRRRVQMEGRGFRKGVGGGLGKRMGRGSLGS
jgi:hypothetical protein